MRQNSHLILVRHSLPSIDLEQPANQWMLSNEGRRRARILSEKLTEYKIQRIFSSWEPKAKETAQIIGAELGVLIEVKPNLHEHERLHLTPSLTKTEFEQLVRQLFERPDQQVFGLETADQAYTRFSQAIEVLLEPEGEQDILVVTHGTVITLLVCCNNPIEPFEFWKRLGLPSFVVLSIPQMRLVDLVGKVVSG